MSCATAINPMVWTARTPLLAHQSEAVAKLLPSKVGALFMEMGTGKSRTAIELVRLRQAKIGRVIWFCPVSLKETVRFEIIKHTDCPPEAVHVFDDKTSERRIPDALWYIVGIESMSASPRVICTVNNLITERSFVIVDESSYIKGHRADRTERITYFGARARYRLILTGTPMSQGVVDLYAQMRFLSPKILGYSSFYSFAANHLEYSDKYPGLIVRAHNTAWLAAKIQPYVYQVTKDECLDLPDKLYETRYCSMTPEQAEAYEEAKDELLLALADDEIDSYAIFRLFSALQQIVCGFWNRRNERTREMERIVFPDRRLPTMVDAVTSIPANEKVIVWAKYRYDIERIAAALRENFGEPSVVTFFGDLSEKQRANAVERFRTEARFFVATPSCGGHGLTLNDAAHVVFYNNGFKYSERLQAEDRNHRIGQARKVTYIDIHCISGIDDRIANAILSKGNAVEAFKREVDKVKGKGKDKRRELVKAL